MTNQIMLSVVEMLTSIVIEGIILSMIFAFISNQSSEKQTSFLKAEMNNIESQNKFIYEQLMNEIESAKTEVISQIKESEAKQ